ncbi:hypothetical protein P2H44_17275 [Albimonas sp. CAU 1670]|uniref:hypothetical protein n=1 Tax=Albimonas sp. CAU 1670 TaxID=3032599 RepID=UPI0023D9B0F6|nr:hypothetical protein [Albimonas sp. CAU 1670]MDF2234315.1 hypothetical protein [Albimonas sp. CAU 1670]
MSTLSPAREPSAPDARPAADHPAPEPDGSDRSARETAAFRKALEDQRAAELLSRAAASSQTHPHRGGIAHPHDAAEAVAEDEDEAALLREQAARIGDGRASAGMIVFDRSGHARWLAASGLAMAVLVGVFLVLG